MITLNGYRDISQCRLYRDDVNPLSWYVMPFTPRIALDDKKNPIFSLVWHRRDVSHLTEEERRTKLGGGILTLSAELAPTPEQMTEIRKTLGADPDVQARVAAARPRWWTDEIRRDKNKLGEALQIAAVPVKEGSVSIAVLAEDAAAHGEFIGNLIGAGKVSMLGNQRASFMAKLTQDGVVLMWEMLERNLAAIRIAYEMRFDHRLDAVTMVVWADARKSYHAVQEQWQNLQDNARFSTRTSGNSTKMSFSRDQDQKAGDIMQEVSTASQSSSVTIIPEAGGEAVPADQIQELTKMGNEMISEFLASTFLEFKPGEQTQFTEQPTLATELPSYDGKKYGHHGVNYYSLKKWDESMTATLNSTFKSKSVLTTTIAPNDNLSNILAGKNVEDFRTKIDINPDFYKYLDVQLVCTANFDEDPVDLIRGKVSYAATGPQGAISAVKDFMFKKDTPPQHFATYLAAPDKRNYNYEYEVFYKGGAETMLVSGKSDGTVLVLDTDRLGVLRVEVQLGAVNWDRYMSVILKLSYGSGSQKKETEFTLTQQNDKQVWNEVIAKDVTEAYTYQVTFVDKESRKVEVPAQTSRSKRLVINQPLQEDMEIAVVGAGDFGAEGMLSRIVVALRYRDAANNYNVDDVFTLNGTLTSTIWKIPLRNTGLRSYEYQTTVFYTDGVTRAEPWKQTSDVILVIGDPFGFRVTIRPTLLKNRGFSFGTINLKFVDPQAGIRSEKTLEIENFTTGLMWRFRLGDLERHTFTYQLTLFRDDGTEVKLPETQHSQEVLVLKPPAQTEHA
jgi:hypothetical protein